METFNTVKNTVSNLNVRYKKIRAIHDAIEQVYHNGEDVSLIYDTDYEENKKTHSKVWRLNDESVLLKNLKMIPICAIKRVDPQR